MCRDKKYPAGMLGSSVALHRHELAVRVKRTFTWIAGGLRDIIGMFGRRNLRVAEDFSASEFLVDLFCQKRFSDMWLVSSFT